MFPSIQYSSANASWFEQLVAPLLQSGTTKPLQRRSMQQLKKHVFSYIWGGLQWKHTKQQWSADCSCHFDLQPFDSQGYSLTLSGQLRTKKNKQTISEQSPMTSVTCWPALQRMNMPPSCKEMSLLGVTALHGIIVSSSGDVFTCFIFNFFSGNKSNLP